MGYSRSEAARRRDDRLRSSDVIGESMRHRSARRELGGPSTRHTASASIIIRTKNEEASIGATLDSILSQRIRAREILIIDSGSTDRTLLIAARYPVQILTIRPDEWSYPRALNRAAACATGDALVFLSAHCIPASVDWLHNLLQHFADPMVAGVWGPQLRPGRPLPDCDPPLYQEPGTYCFENRTWGLSNANAAVRRSLWDEVPFDESMPATEDKAWGREMMNRGFVIVHDPSAAVWHERHSVLSAYRRQRLVMAGFALMFPESQTMSGSFLRTVGRAGLRTARFHASRRDPNAVWYDIRRAPASLAAIVGGLTRRRRSR